MPLSDKRLANLQERLAAKEKTGNYNDQVFVPMQDLKQLLDDNAQLKRELHQRRTEIEELREGPKQSTTEQTIAALLAEQDKEIVRLVRIGKTVRMIHDELIIDDR